MTISELYRKCGVFTGNTTVVNPIGADAPPSMRAMSENMDRESLKDIASWEVPDDAATDEDLKKLLADAKGLAAKGLAQKEQVSSTVADLRKHLRGHYTVSE